jgi:hypothetical protein
MFFFLISCSGNIKNCEISPDYEKTIKSAVENQDNLSETELRAMKMECGF